MGSTSLAAKECAGAYKTAKYRGHRIKYTHDHAIYNNLHIPIRIRNMEAARRIYIETDDYKIFETTDMLSFEFVGPGSLLGVVDDYAICKDSDIYIYNGERRLHLQFRIKDELLYYVARTGGGAESVKNRGPQGKDTAFAWDNTENTVNNISPNSQQPAPACIAVDRAVVYKRYLVVWKGRNILFVGFDGEVDTQCRVSHNIDSVRCVRIDGVLFLRVEYGDRASCYYHSQLVCSDSLSNAEPSDGVRLGGAERLVFRHLCRPDKLSLIKKEITSSLEVSMANALNRGLHASPSFKSFAGLHCSRDRGDGTHVLAFCTSYQEYFHGMKRLAAAEWFYELPGSFSDFYRHGVVDTADPVFLTRVYKRVFFYDNRVKKTKRLAYKVIRRELGQSAQPGSLGMKTSVFRRIHGDLRAREITDIMTECSITIEANVDDTDAIRQKAFLVRFLAGAGAFLLNSGDIPYQASIAVQINGHGIEEMVPEDLVFLSGVYYSTVVGETSPVWTDARKMVVFGMGRDFGLALAGRLEDERYQTYLGRLKDADGKNGHLRYTLLILASHRKKHGTGGGKRPEVDGQPLHAGNRTPLDRQRSWDAACGVVYNDKINQILANQIRNSDLGLKKAAIASLAVYNVGSGNSNLFCLLFKECQRFGSTDLERNTQFYDRKYRSLAAVAASLIFSVQHSIQLADSFCELIINGLSFLGSNVYKNCLQRYDDCRHDEVFYSELFVLVNDFATPIDRIVGEMDSVSEQCSAVCIHRMAARVFYISLKHLHSRHRDKGVPGSRRDAASAEESPGYVRSLFSFVEKIEDNLGRSRKWRVLFDFSLVSLSVILNSTFNLNVLRILRRQILVSKEITDSSGASVFEPKTKNMARFYGSGYESMLYYKLCIGVVCCGFGTRRLRITGQVDYKLLIVTFFYAGNSLPSFEPADLLRLLILKSTGENVSFKSVWAENERKDRLKRARKRLMRGFIRRFEEMDDVDRKFTVDVLSDFYENYSAETASPLFDLRFLAKVLSIIR